jgi:DNA helicase-2/ATP-dependent DNA helicase PcrA
MNPLTSVDHWEIVFAMSFIADLHIHSHFSRATSEDLIPEDLSFWAQKKGIALIGTGDLTHPGWVEELREKLVEAENGLYRLRPDLEKAVEEQVSPSCKAPTRFVLSGEISCIYKRGDRIRKIHNLVLLPDLKAVQKLNSRLQRIGNIVSDGRPILGLDSRDLLEILLEVSDRAFFIPAHIWTPWFSLFGSKSGFDSIQECFGDLASHIHALETGLSSDPPMNRLLSSLDNYLLVSNSDAHSAARLGREANIFDVPFDYDLVVRAMTQKNGFEGTVEFFPEEGKYHFDGHRKCRISLHPSETKRHKGICPTCGKPLTVGVLSRVYELSDRDEPKLSKNFFSLIPLTEILSEILDCGPSAKRVISLYEDLLAAMGPELDILMHAPLPAIEKAGGPLLREAIDRMRQNRVIRQEGYDGEYGVIRLFEEAEKNVLSGQTALFPLSKKPSPQKEKRVFEKSITPDPTEEASRPRSHSSHSILGPLNDAQKEAVLHDRGHLLIVAGPGTGKTMTLTHRMAYQIESGQVSPDQILALTFTNKAAGEMRQRISSLLSESLSGKILISTFHAFCLQVLRDECGRTILPPDFILCSETDVSFLVDQVLLEALTGKRTAREFVRKLPQLKMASALGGKDVSQLEPLLPLYRKYQDRLRQLGMLDLDDLEVETLRLFQSQPEVAVDYGRRFPRIFVDEYQDTNPLQVEILKALVYNGTNLSGALSREPCPVCVCAIGDPDQAIYGFRAADVKNFYRFEADFPGARKIILSRNYRSTQTVLDGAAALLEKEEPLQGSGLRGDKIRLAPCRTDAEEAEMIIEHIERLIGGTSYFSVDSGRVHSHEDGEGLCFGDLAVLFRLNSQGDALEEAFARAGLPFVRSGEKPLVHRYPVNVVWRLLQSQRYPDHAHYYSAYLSLLREHNLSSSLPPASSPFIREVYPPDSWRVNPPETGKDGGRRKVTDLIDQAARSHGFNNLTDEGADALRGLREVAKNFEDDLSSFLDALSLERAIDHAGLLGDRVALMSLHAAKGLEWPVVFITGCEERLLPCTLFGDHDDEEEKRLLYVGMTRARSRLILSSASRRTLNGRVLEMKPSPFLSLIPKQLRQALDRGTWKPKKTHKQLDLF